MKRYLALFSALLFGACLYAQGTAAAEEQLPVPSAAQASDHFDPLAATNAYLAMVPPDKKARSDAYFEGGYWLLLWDFLAPGAAYFLLLSTGWSARMHGAAAQYPARPTRLLVPIPPGWRTASAATAISPES